MVDWYVTRKADTDEWILVGLQTWRVVCKNKTSVYGNTNRQCR